MRFAIKGRGEYIVIRPGEKNHCLKELLSNVNKSSHIKIVSKNAYVAACLQNGTIIGYCHGKTTVNVYSGGTRIKKFRVIVLPGAGNSKGIPVLVNRFNGIPENYLPPKDLVKVEAGIYNWNINKDIFACKSVVKAYDQMSKAAARDNVFMCVSSGYRSYEDQKKVIDSLNKSIGCAKTARRAAPVGFSEHHTGMALDVKGMQKTDGTYVTENESVYKWIEDNCHRYGFIIKNLEGKEYITGSQYEPWHIRYVGNLHIAKFMHDNNLTLDEFVGIESENIANNIDVSSLRHSNIGKDGNVWKFSLKDILDIIGVDEGIVPEEYKSWLGLNADQICHDKIRINGKRNILFDVWPKESNVDRLAEYIKRGNTVVISSREYSDSDGNKLPIILVENAYKAYCKIGRFIKKSISMPTIGITGSVGKTTTLMLCEYVFAEKYKTYVGGPGGRNYNIPVEMIYQMIKRYSPEYEIHIQECGGGRSCLVEEAAELLQVDAFGVTKISKSHHIDKYKDSDDLIADKTSFDRVRKPDAFGVINLDDEVLANYPFKSRIITYAINNNDADYVGENIVQDGDILSFDIRVKNDSGEVIRNRFSINIIGKHNVYNALMVYAMAKQYGLSDDEIQKGFSKYESGKIRQNIRCVAGRIMYIDCFNVCKDSILSCVEALKEIEPGKGGRRIAVLGGENALGNKTNEINFETGTELKDESIDRFIFFGPKEKDNQDILNYYGNGNALYRGAETVLPEEKISYVDDLKELASILANETRIGDVILFKGIFRLPMFAAIDMAFGTNYTIYDVNFKGEPVKDKSYFGKYYNEIDGTNLLKPLKKELYLPENIEGKPVVRIGKQAFKNRSLLEIIEIGKSCRTIGEECFMGCINVKRIIIPESLVNIEKKAFYGCESMKRIELKNVCHIEDDAFANCKNLRKVYLSEKCGYIGDNAFKGCNKLTIIGASGSYAEQYARENDIDFQISNN